jgi:hypothetical protein
MSKAFRMYLLRMTVKPSSFKSVVGTRVRTPKVAALWRGVKNTSTRTSLKRRILQTARMGPMRKCGNSLG